METLVLLVLGCALMMVVCAGMMWGGSRMIRNRAGRSAPDSTPSGDDQPPLDR